MIRRLAARLLGLERQIEDLQRRVRELSWDEPFGMWTRSAFLQFCRVMPRGERTLAFVDLDDIHHLNHQLGYTEVDRRIRATFSIPFRASDIVARWYSGDELVILFDAGLEGATRKIAELKGSAAANGLSFASALGTWQVGKAVVEDVVDGLSRLTEQGRRSNG